MSDVKIITGSLNFNLENVKLNEINLKQEEQFELVEKELQALVTETQSILPALKQYANELPKYRTSFELETVVLNDLNHPTPFSKYIQCLREIEVVYTNIRQILFDLRETDLRLKKIERSIALIKDDIDFELANIDREKILLKKEILLSRLKSLLKEYYVFSNLIEKYKSNFDKELTNYEDQLLVSRGKFFIGQIIVAISSPDNKEKTSVLSNTVPVLSKIIEKAKEKNLLDKIFEGQDKWIIDKVKEWFKL